MQAAGIPDAEALPDRPAQPHDQRRMGHAVVAPASRDLARQARADRAVEVRHFVAEGAAALVVDGVAHVTHHSFGQLALVERRVVRIGAELRLVVRKPCRRKDGAQVELALLGRRSFHDLQQLGAADELRDASDAELRHDLAAFLRHEAEIVDHHLRQADEVLAAQHVVLRRDAGRAVVEMADAQVLAAERDHRCGAEAEALGADDRRLDHIEAGLQAAIGLQAHPVAQVVDAQRLVRLRQPQLPRRARVLDRAERARAGAAVVAGNRDEVGIGLGNARGHGAHARLGDQLHRHQRLRVDLLEIEDQLRQVLDRIDVVMRRRRDQADAGPRKPEARDHVVDLVAGKLPALARLGALRDLDLQHLGVDQVFRRHAEAARSHLLDL